MGRCPCSGQSCHVPSPSRLLNFGRSSSADLPFRIASHRNSSLSRLIAAGLFSPSPTSLRRRLCLFPPIVFSTLTLYSFFPRRQPPLVASHRRFTVAHSLLLLWSLLFVRIRDIPTFVILSHHSLLLSLKDKHIHSLYLSTSCCIHTI